MKKVILFILFFYNGMFAFDELVQPGYTKASMSSVLYGYEAHLTVDGNTDQHSANCSRTLSSRDDWLRVDLRHIYNIKMVKMWYDKYKKDALKDISIRLSNTPSPVPPSYVCYREERHVVNISSYLEVKCHSEARYIWFYRWNPPYRNYFQRKAIHVCEVQVIGCEIGMYGVNCSNTCDSCSGGKDCDVVNGACRKGCIHGLTGTFCNESACSDGFYGMNCTKTCGHCDGDRHCDKISGTCPTGCKIGYYGEFCQHKCVREMSVSNCLGSCSTDCENAWWCNKTVIYNCSEEYNNTLYNTSIKLTGTSISFELKSYFYGTAAGIVVMATVVIVLLIRRKCFKGKKNEKAVAVRTSSNYQSGEIHIDPTLYHSTASYIEIIETDSAISGSRHLDENEVLRTDSATGSRHHDYENVVLRTNLQKTL